MKRGTALLVLLMTIVWIADPPAGATGTLTVEDCWQLMDEGSKLTPAQVSELEAKLQEDPKDLPTRLRLLGHEAHGDAMPPAGVKLLLGVIENNPRSSVAGPICIVVSAFDQRTYRQAIDLWQNLIKANPDDARILGNAATWMEQFGVFHPEFHDQCKTLFEKARALEPQNPDWAEHLGRAWLFDAGYREVPDQDYKLTPEQRVAAAKKGIEQFEAACRLRHERSRATYRLQNGKSYLSILAEASLLADDTNQAKACAIELLKNVDQKTDGWNYGNVIYQYNLFLGKIALQEGQADEAAKYLIAASKTPGSPQLNSFGPDFTLAGALLRHGRPEDRAAVLTFLDEVARFWANRDKQIETWKKDIAAGKIPDDHRWRER
jgi:tetratricopeptide (TPR) repeat protein